MPRTQKLPNQQYTYANDRYYVLIYPSGCAASLPMSEHSWKTIKSETRYSRRDKKYTLKDRKHYVLEADGDIACILYGYGRKPRMRSIKQAYERHAKHLQRLAESKARSASRPPRAPKAV